MDRTSRPGGGKIRPAARRGRPLIETATVSRITGKWTHTACTVMTRTATTLLLAAVAVALTASAASAQQSVRHTIDPAGNPDSRNPAARVQLLTPPFEFAPKTQAPAATIYCLTSNLWEVWSDDAWDPFSQTLAVCENGRQVEVEGQTHYLDEWELGYKWMYTYNGDGNRTGWLWQRANMDGTDYDNYRRFTYEFDGEGHQTGDLREDWDEDSAQWVNVERTITQYDGDTPVAVLDQEWDGSQWVDVERQTYDDQTGYVLLETWDGAAWQPAERYTLEQDGDNFVQTTETWDGSQFVNSTRYSQTDEYRRAEMWNGTAWVIEQNQLTTYDEFGNLVELIEERWNGSAWVNDYRARYVFDATGQFQTEFWLDEWDGTGWKEDGRQLSTLDANGNEIEELWQDWNDSTMEWENGQRYTRTYEAFNVANETVVAADGFSLSDGYPNPANTSTTARYELLQTSHVTITLHDVLGRTVRTLHAGTTPAGEHELTIDVADLAAGLYFYRLQAGGAVLTRSVVVGK